MSDRGEYGRAVPADKRELTAEARADYERRLARAVDDVLDGAVNSAGAAAKTIRGALSNLLFIDAALRPREPRSRHMDALKNAEISRRILAKKAEGLSTPDAVDAVLGAGTYARIAAEAYTALRAKK